MTEHLDTQALTWAALLGKWVQFARSAVALPNDDEGQRMRESVVDLIMLQAVWFSLQHLDDLSTDEKELGMDRAEILIHKHRQRLQARWGDQMPQGIQELLADAQNALPPEAPPEAPPEVPPESLTFDASFNNE